MKKSISEANGQKPLASQDDRTPTTTDKSNIWPPSPRREVPRPRMVWGGPTLTGRAWLDKALGWLASGLPLVFTNGIVPAILHAKKDEIEVYRRMGQMSYFFPVLAVALLCVAAQIALYFSLRPRLPALARGFGWGLWFWTPFLLLTLFWPIIAPLK